MKSDIQISIFDISGKKIYQVTQGVVEGDQNIQMNLKNLRLEKWGIYFTFKRKKWASAKSKIDF